MSTRWIALGLSLFVAAAGAALTTPRTPARAAAGESIIADSLTALRSLTDACTTHDAAAPSSGGAAPSPGPAMELPYSFCDDGKPPKGGGSKGIPVPAAYHPNAKGDDYSGLPAPGTADDVAKADAEDDIQPDAAGDRVTLDVDVSLPVGRPPRSGRPLIVLAHGFGESKTRWEASTVDGGNETWHHSNAWFASQGYVVVNLQDRGHVNQNGEGSSGSTQLISRSYEANDLQYIVGLLVDDDADRRAAGESPLFGVNPNKVAVSGGSYGGFLTYMTLVDPTWTSPEHHVGIKLAAAVPKYTGVDDLESLVPSGHYHELDPVNGKTFVAPTDPEKAPSLQPIGVVKESIVSGFVASATRPDTDHVVLPEWVTKAYQRLQQGEPYDGDATIETVAKKIVRESSAYYQEDFWKRVARGLRIPLFVAGTTTDPLFPGNQAIIFYNKLMSLDKRYPTSMYFGDYQHTYAQNKAKEWADVCGEDRHVCTADDYRRKGKLVFSKSPATLVHEGANTRIDRFIDHYLKGSPRKLRQSVAMSTTVCPANATDQLPADEPGATFVAPTWHALAPSTTTLAWTGGGAATTTTVYNSQDKHGVESDPVARSRNSNIAKCYTTNDVSPGPGVVQYVSDPLPNDFTLLGIPKLDLKYTRSGDDYWIAARLYDLTPDGNMTLVTRGVCKVNAAAYDGVGCNDFDLFNAGWQFAKGDKVVVEVTQNDIPYLRTDNLPSMLQLTEAQIDLPTAAPARLRDPRLRTTR